MLYSTASDWNAAAHKNVALFGMSGLGKTYLSNMLSGGGQWFHYSVDYRIGTHYIPSNVTFDDLSPLSSYLGKPGDPDRGGIPFEEYINRQRQHRAAEIAALKDTAQFISKAQGGCAHFICDTSGSICEVVDPNDPQDPVLTALSTAVLPVWIRGDGNHTEELVRRFAAAPKPMYFNEEFLRIKWAQYLSMRGITDTEVDPDDFILWGYREQLAHRLPLYAAIAQNWGVTIEADEVTQIRDATDFTALIAKAIERKT